MEPLKIGILGAADIAQRRFLPALYKSKQFIFGGVAVADPERKERAEKFVEQYGGRMYSDYEELLQDPSIDAVYIPQPPSLHYKWAEKAILCGKHVLLEKPSTTQGCDTESLITLAKKKQVALCENYAFCYHRQIAEIKSVIESGELGELRLIRTAFGFPYRCGQDFRYQAALGGGALLDCGGYTLKAVQLFLGSSVEVMAAQSGMTEKHDVDMFGSAMLRNQDGLTAEIAFGMDNYYKCELEVWGSLGCLETKRIFTPPADMETEILIRGQKEEKILRVPPDDQFFHILERFAEAIYVPETAEKERASMLHQMQLVEAVRMKYAE